MLSLTRTIGARTVAAALGLVVVLLSGSCSPAEDGPTTTSGGDTSAIRVRFGADVAGFDPATIFQIENQTVAQNIFNGLVKYDEETNEIVPDLAESWDVNDAADTYTFQLREDVQWHKGYGELTAADVKFTVERILDPETGSSYVGEFADVGEVEAVDDSTVTFHLSEPNVNFLRKVAAFNQGWIVSEKAVTELGEDFALNPVGTGPFIFETWSPGNEVILVANEDYFEGAPSLDRIIFKIMPEETAAEVALKNGEIDIFFALQSPDVIDRLRNQDGIEVLERNANHTINLVLNTTREPLGDVRVRQAMAHAINRESLVEDFFEGTKAESNTVLTPEFPEFSEDVPTYPYDPDKARELLSDAGAQDFSFELVSVALAPYDKIVVPIQEDLRSVGVNASINVVERSAYGEARSKGNIDSAITGVVGPPDVDKPLWTLFHSSSWPPGLNTAHYDGVDQLLEKAKVEANEDERLEIYAQVLRKTMEDVPVIPLYADRLYMAASERVEGLAQNSLFTISLYPVSLER